MHQGAQFGINPAHKACDAISPLSAPPCSATPRALQTQDVSTRALLTMRSLSSTLLRRRAATA
eukprot:14740858-Alexandrium_andersonii.AAC.1